MGCDEIGENSDYGEEEDHSKPHNGAAIGAEVKPGFPQRGSRRVQSGCLFAARDRRVWEAHHGLPGVPNARVDNPVEQIDEEIDHYDADGDDQHPALKDRVVAPIDRFDQPFSDARP